MIYVSRGIPTRMNWPRDYAFKSISMAFDVREHGTIVTIRIITLYSVTMGKSSESLSLNSLHKSGEREKRTSKSMCPTEHVSRRLFKIRWNQLLFIGCMFRPFSTRRARSATNKKPWILSISAMGTTCTRYVRFNTITHSEIMARHLESIEREQVNSGHVRREVDSRPQ